MKLSEIFLEAAKFLHRRSPLNAPGMCGAIAAVAPHESLFAIQIMTNLFSPYGTKINHYYWFTTAKENQHRYYVENLKEAKRQRIDILLWCAAIAESEGL